MMTVPLCLVSCSHYSRRRLAGLGVLMNLRLQRKVLFHPHPNLLRPHATVMVISCSLTPALSDLLRLVWKVS